MPAEESQAREVTGTKLQPTRTQQVGLFVVLTVLVIYVVARVSAW